MLHRITMLQGSSVATDVSEKVRAGAAGYKNILVCLDSNHTEDHLLAELRAYAPLTSVGSYCCGFDTIIEDLPPGMYDRPWDKGNNPKTAVKKYLTSRDSADTLARDGRALKFRVDAELDNKLLISVAPGGYLQRI